MKIVKNVQLSLYCVEIIQSVQNNESHSTNVLYDFYFIIPQQNSAV